MKSVNVTEARKRIYSLVDEISQTHEPIHISGKHHNAVLIGEEDWRSIQETMYLLSIPEMRESIIEGLNTPLSETSDVLNWE